MHDLTINELPKCKKNIRTYKILKARAQNFLASDLVKLYKKSHSVEVQILAGKYSMTL